MAVVAARNGVITMQSGDTYPKGGTNYAIQSIVTSDAAGGGSLTLYQGADGSAPVLYSNPATATGNTSQDIFGCLSTGGGLYFSSNSSSIAIYVR